MKRICFFSTGFAFNRLIRMRYYESIMPSNVEMFLFTTDKYAGKEKESYQHEWNLKRTKVVVGKYDKNIFLGFRKFCMKNKIDRVINIGNWQACFLIALSTFLTKTDYIMNIFGDIIAEHHSFREKISRNILFYMNVLLSKKTIFNDVAEYNKYRKVFGNKIKYLPATVNTSLFVPKSKNLARKRLKLPVKRKIVLFVGRIDYQKGSDILIDVIKKNPDVLFVAVGRLIDPNFKKLLHNKQKNLIHYEKKSSEELVDFYNAADIGFFVQRFIGGGLGLTSEECLSCGTPAVNRHWKGVIRSPALFAIPVDKPEANKTIKEFFEKSEKERQELKRIARDYAMRHYSDKTWKNRYIRHYLD